MNALLSPPSELPEAVILQLKPIIRAEDVAKLLNYTAAASFYNARAALEQNGFPRKLPGVNGWSRACIMRWIETNGETYLPEGKEPAPEKKPTALERRYG